MKAFIRGTSWSHGEPDKVRVELEVITSEAERNAGGLSVLVGNYVYIYGESRWRRFINRIKGTK